MARLFASHAVGLGRVLSIHVCTRRHVNTSKWLIMLAAALGSRVRPSLRVKVRSENAACMAQKFFGLAAVANQVEGGDAVVVTRRSLPGARRNKPRRHGHQGSSRGPTPSWGFRLAGEGTDQSLTPSRRAAVAGFPLRVAVLPFPGGFL